MKKLLLLFLQGSSALYGYGYQIKSLKKLNPTTKSYHYWIGVKDFHDKEHTANTMQRAKIEDLLPLYDPYELLVLAEDLSGKAGGQIIATREFCLSSRVGILAGLCNFCTTHNIPVQNMEYRFTRVIGLGPVINNIYADPFFFASARTITIGNLLQEIEHIQTELLAGAPNLSLKKMMNDYFASINFHIKKLNLSKQTQKTIAEYLAPSPHALARLELVKSLLTFDGILIGLKFVDATLKAPHKKKIIAFGGGTHIDEAYELLQKVGGYEPIVNDKFSSNSNKTINIADTTLSKPTPLSIEVLEHYLKN